MAVEQKIKTYKNQKQANHDMAHMGRQGWLVQSSTTGSYRKASFLSWILFGIFNLFRKSKARDITIVYTR